MDGVRFALLGTLTLADGAGNPRTVPGARQRALLARLLLSANAPVSWPEGSAAEARALELWRGTPLLDVSSQVLRDQFVPGLEQLRLQVLEDRADVAVRRPITVGRHTPATRAI